MKSYKKKQTRFFTYFILSMMIVVLVIVSCSPKEQTSSSEQLADIIKTVEAFQIYDKKDYPLGKTSETLVKEDAEFAQSQIDHLNVVQAKNLSETENISRELLAFTLQEKIDSYTYKIYLRGNWSFHVNLNYKINPILAYSDAKKYLEVLNDFPRYAEQYFLLLRQGLKEGMSDPKVIFNGFQSTFDDHIVEDYTKSDFYSPFKNLPDVLTQEQKDSVLVAAKKAIKENVVPTFKKIKTFFEEEYIPDTRERIGVSDTPGGKEFYQNRINYFTTSNEYTANDIHEIGLGEVARIKGEMEKIIKKVGFKGSFQDFLTFLRTDKQFYETQGEELLKDARNIAKKIDAKLPEFFIKLPRRPYGVIKVPDAIAPTYTGGRYSPSSSDTRPGYYLVNTFKLDSRPLYVLPALTAHEAVPGHHLQMALNSELGDSIPKFRKEMYLSAFGEGWGLYSEFLANEMGVYTTPYEEFGKLTYEMWRACRLVVDTGIHSKGWTREQVVNYLLSNTALSEHEVNTETDRYIGVPGQAISYKIGELKIRELRKKAEKALGPRFDIRNFHEIVLGQGTVTLPILERRVNSYISGNN